MSSSLGIIPNAFLASFILKLNQSPTTNLNELNYNNLISIYLNPSSTQWIVTLNNIEVNYQLLRLTDVTGKEVWSYDLSIRNNETIIIPNTNLANGLYFLKTISKQGTEIHKLIKE